MASPGDADVQLSWGAAGLRGGRVRILVDVLSFSTRVDLALAAGQEVVSVRGVGHPGPPDGAPVGPGNAREPGAGSDSLPLPPGLPPEALEGAGVLYTAGLRNAVAVAAAAARAAAGAPVTLVAAGELDGAGTFRPCLGDLLGAGALALLLPGRRSAEAEAAARLFVAARSDLGALLADCEAGAALCRSGAGALVAAAGACDASTVVPRWRDGAFVRQGPGRR